MNIKIQGGGSGKYANNGSSYGAANYLRHEDLERSNKGLEYEPFFNNKGNSESFENIVTDLDQNKAKLGKADAKFFVLTVSPSEKEQKALGASEKERSHNFKKYINNHVMEQYAKSFNKGLSAKDIKYHAKIHHSRDGSKSDDMHSHILVSRKDNSNTKKISPKTNHRSAAKSGTVKSGFHRSAFFENCEKAFDKSLNYIREFKESYQYCNTMKNGTPEQKIEINRKSMKIEDQQKLQEPIPHPKKTPKKENQDLVIKKQTPTPIPVGKKINKRKNDNEIEIEL